MKGRLRALLETGEYLSYAYAYPHKTAYRTLDPAVPLREAWADEDRSALALYLHVPFCEQRCGFCNLFTQVQPKADVVARYVAALQRQADAMAEVLGAATFAQLAVGGGTPTFLSATDLDRVIAVARRLGAQALPTSVEVSPSTLDAEKVAVLREHGTTRVSMGVQSLVAEETRAVQRRQDPADVTRVLALLVDAIAVRNVDLIYGLPGQTEATLCASIDRVVGEGANELYLYPLYVRPLTILGRRDRWDDARLRLYRAGRAHLLALGWRQASMRMFTAAAPCAQTPRYRCQDDGMVGLGPGARSYTRALHYASPFAVGQAPIRSTIEQWIAATPRDHLHAHHGFRLDLAEQRRRHLVLSLLEHGVERAGYRARFGADVLEHFAELHEAIDCELVTVDDDAVRLTERGMERADVLGHWLQSAAVVRAREEWTAA
jgi:oxygen-independent coproporphyrinogen-3 oxidase